MADQSPGAKDAAIAALAAAEPSIHCDTAYGILRGDPAFNPESSDDRVYVIMHWAPAALGTEIQPPPSTGRPPPT